MTRMQARLLVLAAALGYFVDIYDLVLFGILRKPSLADLGVPDAQILDIGVRLFNWQMGGMLLGGILWGVIGDKLGRLKVLFGSIALYSLANIANGFVHGIESYAWLRLLAGLGLAGELGAGITLVSEIMSAELRGWGTTLVAGVGVWGAVVAATVGGHAPWRTSYFIGGGLGLALLVFRIGLAESGLFARAKELPARRGAFLALFTSWQRLRRYLAVVLTGLPIWFVISIFVVFAPELGTALGLPTQPKGGTAILYCYVGLAIGDLASGALSQVLRTRRRVIAGFLVATVASIAVYFAAGGTSLTTFYGCCFLLGISGGYWAVFVTSASEQFGTNLRATVTTTAPNFVRGAVVGCTSAFALLKPKLGVLGSAGAVGAVVMTLAFVGVAALEETYGKDLDFVEPV